MKKKSRLSGLSRWGADISVTNVFLWVAVLVLAFSILTASNSVVAAVGIVAATANYAHSRHIDHSTTAILRAKHEVQAGVESRVAEALQSLTTWRSDLEQKVREAVQTSEVAAKLRVARTPGGIR